VQDRVAGISVASTAVSVVTVGAKDEVFGPVILWMDTRAAAEAAEIATTKHPALRYTGGSVSAEWMLPKALWLKRHEPERYQHAALIVELHDLIIHALTGRWVLSRPTICAEWTYLPPPDGWPVDLLEAVGLDDLVRRWPTIVLPAGGLVGKLSREAARDSGLPAGIPVSQGLMDSYAAAIAANPFIGGRLTVSLGSSSSYLVLTDRPIFDERLLGPVRGAFPGHWVVQGGQTSAGTCLRWFAAKFAPGTSFKELDEEAKKIPPASGGVGALDTFQGSRTPHRDPGARGGFFGLGLHHGRAHLYRALLEAVAYGGRQIIDVMRSRGVEVRDLIFCGGGSRSSIWMQTHADVLGVPITVLANDAPAALGAAICAAVGCGLHETLENASATMTQTGSTYKPNDRLASLYQAGYERYQDAYRTLNSGSRELT
jgi:ribulose kinase